MPINSFDDYPMNWTPLLKDRTPPLYTKLATMLAEDIKKGILRPGMKLPPQRELADFLDVHLSTITRTYKLCEKQGLICARVGQGTFIASDVNTSNVLLYPHNKNNLIQLGTILPPADGNEKIIALLREATKSPDFSRFLNYRESYGTPAQREFFSHWLQNIDIHCPASQLLLATGGQNALSAALLALFRPGERIGTLPLTFPSLKGIARMIGIQLIPLPVSAKNPCQLDLHQLESFLQQEHIRGLYLIPDQSNPTTYTMPLAERQEIARIAKATDVILIEDAINRMFTSEKIPPFYSLAPNNTVYIFSTSKFLAAGLRTAIICTAEKYLSPLQQTLYNLNLMISPLNAELVHRIFRAGLVDEILEEKRKVIRRRNQLADSIFPHTLQGNTDCTFRWMLLPSGFRKKSISVEELALKENVQVFDADRFAIGNAVPPAAIRLCATAPKTEEELVKGLQILKSIINQY